MTISRCIAVALCVLGPLTSFALAANINGEATYISFAVPGALGTFPISINASMTVAGYYDESSTSKRGFVRDAEGTITTFNIAGAAWTQPQSINAAGDITGFYISQLGLASQGFLRYADGRIIILPGNPSLSVVPVAINDFDDIVGDYFHNGVVAFARSRTGEFTPLPPPNPVATSINATGTVVGVIAGPYAFTGFVAHPDGYWAVVGPAAISRCGDQTIPDAINAAGIIAGTFTTNYSFTSSCPINTGGFVQSPDGVFTLFQPPGQMPYFHDLDLESPTLPLHLVSIDDTGDITGSYADAAGVMHGFVRNPYGTMTSFDPPQGTETYATSINDGGAIAGYYSYKAGSGPPVGFIRVP